MLVSQRRTLLRRQRETARRQADEAHRSQAVAYLKTIAETIKGMREQLAQKQVPRVLGHHFSGLLDSYEDFLQPYLKEETRDELDKLKRRVQESAEFVDPIFDIGRDLEPEELKKRLTDMERVEGDVRAQATRISPTESRRPTNGMVEP